MDIEKIGNCNRDFVEKRFLGEKQEEEKRWNSSVFFDSEKPEKFPAYFPHTMKDLAAKATVGASQTARSFDIRPLERIGLNYNKWKQEYREKIQNFIFLIQKINPQNLENLNSEILSELEKFAKDLSGQKLSRIKSPTEYLKIIIDALSGEFLYFQKIKNDGLTIDESLFFLTQQSEDIKFIQENPSTAPTLDKVYMYEENYLRKLQDLIIYIQSNIDNSLVLIDKLLELTADRLILEKIELAQGTRSRAEIFKNLTKKALDEYFREKINPKEPFVLLEIAAGTAFSTTQALKEFIKENLNRIKKIEDLNIKILLIDIDGQALHGAMNDLSAVLLPNRGSDEFSDKVIAIKPEDGGKIFNRDFIPHILESLELSGSNLTNCSGLYDYLQNPLAIRLSSNIKKVKKNNGQIYVSNIASYLHNQYKSKPILEKNTKGEGGLLNWLPMIDRSAEEFTKIIKKAGLNIKKRIITNPPSYIIAIIN